MNDETQNSTPPEGGTPAREFSDALLQSAIERLKTRGGSTRSMACMGLPAPVFNDLCARLMDRTQTVRDTADWLAGQVQDAPTKSSVDRFSQALREEYNLAQLADRRRAAESYVSAYTEGDPNAQVVALNNRFTELLTDAMLSMDNLDNVEPDLLFALTGAAKSVAQVTFGKQMMDARIAGLKKQIEERDASIALKEQALAERDVKLKSEQDKRRQAIAAAEKAAAAGGGASVVVERVREILGIGG